MITLLLPEQIEEAGLAGLMHAAIIAPYLPCGNRSSLIATLYFYARRQLRHQFVPFGTTLEV